MIGLVTLVGLRLLGDLLEFDEPRGLGILGGSFEGIVRLLFETEKLPKLQREERIMHRNAIDCHAYIVLESRNI